MDLSEPHLAAARRMAPATVELHAGDLMALEMPAAGLDAMRLRPWLSEQDFRTLEQLCDPGGPAFALRRPDFHYMQTFTLVTGRRP